MRIAGSSETAVGALPLSPCTRCRQSASSPAKKPGFLGENDKGMPYDCLYVRGEGLRARTLARMSPFIQSPSTHLAPVV